MDLTSADLTLIEQYLRKNLTEEELAAGHFLDREPDRAVRVQLAEIDLEFFNRFYLSHHFSLPPAPIHRTLTQRLQYLIDTPGRRNGVYVMPRGHAKTTIATLGLPMWCVCFNKRKHIPIISDSFDQAKDQLGNIKNEIEDNDRINEDFGVLKGTLWQAADIMASNGVRIRALGQGMKIRGRKIRSHRPDLLVADDLEELQGVQSPTQRSALLKWFQGSLMRSGWKDTKVVVLGNYLHHDCLLKNLVQNPLFDSLIFKALEEWPDRMDLWDQWRAIAVNLADPLKERHALEFYKQHEKDMLQGARCAWPEGFPLYDLMLIRISEGEASFEMELQNNPQDPDKQLFTYYGTYESYQEGTDVWLRPMSGRPAARLSECALFAFTDPSMGATTRSDYSAIVILAKSKSGQMFVLEGDVKRRPPQEIMVAQNNYATMYRITRWGIENNQFQALFSTESAKISAEKGIYLPVVAVNQLSNKAMRIQSLQPDLENQYILFPERGMELLKQQLREWPSGAHDDGPDALEGARTLAKEWSPLTGQEIITGELHGFGEDSTKRLTPLGKGDDPWALADANAEATIRAWKLAQLEEKEAEPIPQSTEDLLRKVLTVDSAFEEQ